MTKPQLLCKKKINFFELCGWCIAYARIVDNNKIKIRPIDKLCSSAALQLCSAHLGAVMAFALYTHPKQLFLAVSQLPVVRSEHVRTLFDLMVLNLRNPNLRLVQCNTAMHTRTHFKRDIVSLVSGLQSRCLRPFFTSTESQESKSDMNIAWQCALRYI